MLFCVFRLLWSLAYYITLSTASYLIRVYILYTYYNPALCIEYSQYISYCSLLFEVQYALQLYSSRTDDCELCLHSRSTTGRAIRSRESTLLYIIQNSSYRQLVQLILDSRENNKSYCSYSTYCTKVRKPGLPKKFENQAACQNATILLLCACWLDSYFRLCWIVSKQLACKRSAE